MWNLSRPFPQGVSSYSNSPLSGAWEEQPLLPHTPASQERPAPAPIAPFPRASPLPVPSHLHLRPSFQAQPFQVYLPRGEPGGKKGEREAARERALRHPLSDASELPESAKQRLALSGLA